MSSNRVLSDSSKSCLRKWIYHTPGQMKMGKKYKAYIAFAAYCGTAYLAFDGIREEGLLFSGFMGLWGGGG